MDRTLPYKFNANMSTIDCRSVAKHAEPRNSIHPADQACCCMEISNCLEPHLLASVRGVYLLPGCMELCIHRDTSPEENSGLSYLLYLRSGGRILRGIRMPRRSFQRQTQFSSPFGGFRSMWGHIPRSSGQRYIRVLIGGKMRRFNTESVRSSPGNLLGTLYLNARNAH